MQAYCRAPAVIILADLTTRPQLPASQGAADRIARDAENAFWDHTEDCEACLDAEDVTRTGTHCRAGAMLIRRSEDASAVAADFAGLDRWYRRGGREAYNAGDYIAG